MPKTIEVPDLDHDAMMENRYGRRVGVRGRLERRIVAALCAHMAERGWLAHSVRDSDGERPVNATKEHPAKDAMELIFNLDESRLVFSNGKGARHAVLLIGGNGIDIVSDWGFAHGDGDGFNAAMRAFDAEAYA